MRPATFGFLCWVAGTATVWIFSGHTGAIPCMLAGLVGFVSVQAICYLGDRFYVRK